MSRSTLAGEVATRMSPFSLAEVQKEQIRSAVRSAGGPTGSFRTLMVLSTLIATFGLISNSTATVIGAMIVAPLMGPIQALALSMVEGDARGFRRALQAELLGIVLCVGTSAFVAWAVGTDKIDYAATEIRGRVHPTLYDLAVGLAAGLAGAYATVNPQVSGSVAGVAIAVALVPPLSVSGMCLAGGLRESAVGSFVLFLANFLTIELAGVMMFAVAGLGETPRLLRSRAWWGAVSVKLVLLLATCAFLSGQLHSLVVRRQHERVVRNYLRRELVRMPGASIEDVELAYSAGKLSVELLIRAPEEPRHRQLSGWQRQLSYLLKEDVVLSVGTLLSTYYSSNGQMFGAALPTPHPRAAMLAQWQEILEGVLTEFPGVEMTAFRQLDDSTERPRFLVTLQSPYEFTSDKVRLLQDRALESAREKAVRPSACELVARTVVTRDYDLTGPLRVAEPGPVDPQEIRNKALLARAEEALSRGVAQVSGSTLLEMRLITATDEPPSAQFEAVIRSMRPLSASQLLRWEKLLTSRLRSSVTLQVENRLGQVLRTSPTPGPTPIPTPVLQGR